MKIISSLLYEMGGFVNTFLKMIFYLKEINKVKKEIIFQIYEIGLNSLPLVIFISAFLGMVASVQTAYQIRDFVPLIYLGAGVAKGVMIELGPVITGLVVAGRVSSGIAAEIGTMKVTEQIDALEVMGISPYRFLFIPRVIAGMLALPMLTIISDIIAILSGMWISNFTGITNYETFARGAKLFFLPKDLFGGLFKASIFGIILSFSGSFYGIETKGGAQGVGISATKAVVTSCLLILVFDYLIGVLIYG